MDISIIVCSHNNSARLRETLGNLERCRVAPGLSVELLLVNNASDDDTWKLKEHASSLFAYKYLNEPEKGKSNALNAGIGAATGDLILFTDDDVRPSENWITSYWEGYKRHGNKAIYGGNIHSIFENENFNKILLKYSPFSVSGLNLGSAERTLEDREYFLGANYAIPSALLKTSGGFKRDIGLNPSNIIPSTGEETAMQLSLQHKGIKRILLPESEIWHFVPKEKTRLAHSLKRRLAFGIYKATIDKEYESDRKIWTILRLNKELSQRIIRLMTNRKDKEAMIRMAHEIAFLSGKMIGLFSH